MTGRDVVEMVDLTRQPDALEAGGVWFVVADFEGPVRAWRFAHVDRHAGSHGRAPETRPTEPWHGPAPSSWRTSLDEAAYRAAVATVREHVRQGSVYQANICRILSAPLPPTASEPDAAALAERLATGNPAPYEGVVHVPATSGLDPVWVVSASPELFLRVERSADPDGSRRSTVTSAPIKGTAPTPDGLLAKDRAENIMITDLVRNDLQRVCEPGSVEVTHLLAVEKHPGLAHLVSTVVGTLRPQVTQTPGPWGPLLAATFPPASVSGAPKSSALRIIGELEPVPRGPYCGALGWIDADSGTAELAVGIRTFWWTPDSPHTPQGGPHLHFGTGAGITWGSDPGTEWRETELKAHRLIALASTAD
ncbi:chorismate-binding protein [Sanguibacter sp. 25GB23B1]|uniref:chorismate-binding protein n=1 Tax=unclassified Sanguibacter TaxID=2645534 RepID=UPI0032AEA94F